MTEKQLFYPLLSVYLSLILGDLQNEKLQIVSIFRFGHKKRGLFQCPLLGSGKIPKSTLIRKLEAGDRNIYREYIAFCNYKGKRHAMLLKRRKAEFALLYVP